MAVIRIPTTITRPANTTTYSANQQVVDANGIGAHLMDFGSVSLFCNRIYALKSTTTTTNALFRLYLCNQRPTLTGVDGASISGATRTNVVAIFSGNFTNAVSNGAYGVFVDDSGQQPLINGPMWILIETLAGYAPGSAETFTFQCECFRVES